MPIQFPSLSQIGVAGSQPLPLIAGYRSAQKRIEEERKAQIANAYNQQILANLPAHQAAELAKSKAEAALTGQQAAQIPALLPFKEQLLKAQMQQAATRGLFTPEQAAQQALDVQRLKNEATIAAAKIKDKATDPFAKSQATQLSIQLKGVTANAIEASDKVLPTYKTALDALNNYNLTGPGGTTIAWATPAGQRLKIAISKIQLMIFKGVKNIRTQKEFNKIMETGGGMHVYGSVLRKLFNEAIKRANNDVRKLKYYHKYTTGGGRDPGQVEINWEKQLHPETVSRGTSGYSVADLIKAAQGGD